MQNAGDARTPAGEQFSATPTELAPWGGLLQLRSGAFCVNTMPTN
jgi:hypothetical protein